MGVLNVTPDSFSDGGRDHAPGAAVARAMQMLEDGADLIDVGGESSRPGAEPVTAVEELDRILPVVQALTAQEILVSVDTTKAEVARAALKAGATIINDISGLTFDPEMVGVAREFRAGVVIMHMQGTPSTMQHNPRYQDVVQEVGDFLQKQVAEAEKAGIPRENIVVDPGIGFGKEFEHNIELLRHLRRIGEAAGRPVLVGVSRKRFIGTITGREVSERLAGSLAAAGFALLQGARILRVHDVKESCDTARMLDKLQPATGD